jgi:tetratricopeptide (TPR) repeat protein
VGGGWQLSAGDLAELLGPTLFAFAVLASTWILFDSGRRAGRLRTLFWTLAALLAPFFILPLYLAARLLTRSHDTDAPAGETQAAGGGEDGTTVEDSDAETSSAEAVGADFAPDAAETETADEATAPAGSAEDEGVAAGRVEKSRGWRQGFTLPLAYAAVLLALGSVYFALDWQSFDAHFARARRAKLRGDAERTLREYRAALGRREDAHTRKLLGLELLREGRAAEALAEFRAAARGAEEADGAEGTEDDSLTFYEARSLDVLARREEAAEAYRTFMAGPTCDRDPADARCISARERLK